MLQSCRRIARADPGKPDYAFGPRDCYRAAKNRVGRCRRPLLSASRSLYGVGSERIMSSPVQFSACDGAKLYRNTHLQVKLKALDFSSTCPARPLSSLSRKRRGSVYGAEVAQRGNSESARGGNPVKWLDRVPTLAGGAKGRLTPPAGAAGGGGGRRAVPPAPNYPFSVGRVG